MRPAALILALTTASVAASTPVTLAADPLDAALAQARSEAANAEAEAKRLAAVAARQQDEAARLGAEQRAAAEAIAAAEAQISAADLNARRLAVQLEMQRAALRQQQAPASALLGGLAMMAQRPPLLAIADSGGTEEFVRVRLLLGATMPVIRQRTAALRGALDRGRRLEAAAAEARQAMAARRDDLAKRQAEFAMLEQKALRSAGQTGLAALGAGDEALTSGEETERLNGERARGKSAARLAAEIAALGEPPSRPFAAEGSREQARLPYQLPAEAAVTNGLGSVSDSGIRSRGIMLATGRGATLTVPADGTILFAGPYRGQDGIVIIDHGGGWKTLILNAATDLQRGAQVRAGQRLGQALGPISVELSRNGQHFSPALIAGSSRSLSKSGKSS
jgi:septal ring factor EnvC (AmiA/AmiB activator)